MLFQGTSASSSSLSSSRVKLGVRRGQSTSSSGRRLPLNQILGLFMFSMVVFYVLAASSLFSASSNAGLIQISDSMSHHDMTQQLQDSRRLPASVNLPSKSTNNVQNAYTNAIAHVDSGGAPRQYQYWKNIALSLAGLTPEQILVTLETDDPFGVRSFERRLLEEESKKGAFLSSDELRGLFQCPRDRMTLPDQRHHNGIETAFHDADNPTFLFFQHLRKAGGTNFCELAKTNLKPFQVPSYFCMPDMDWSGKRCAGCLHSFTNDQIYDKMKSARHKIIGNEWDSFEQRFFGLSDSAVFATSFRKPLHRALSQFRFECIEDRGCKLKRVEDFWTKRKDLTNVYTWTFSNMGIRKISVNRTPEAAQQRQEAMSTALDVVAKFHLVLVMEWLAYASPEVERVLGFHDTSALTKRIRPHIGQAKRNDGQEKNMLGAAGITKASWDPKEYLSPEQYKIMSEDLALDEILTDAARRMFLERLVCTDV